MDNSEIYKKLKEKPVSMLDTGTIEVGGVYRCRRGVIVWPNPEFSTSIHSNYSLEEISKGELAWFIFRIENNVFAYSYGVRTYQILYKERIYYTSAPEVFLNKNGPDWERVL